MKYPYLTDLLIFTFMFVMFLYFFREKVMCPYFNDSVIKKNMS